MSRNEWLYTIKELPADVQKRVIKRYRADFNNNLAEEVIVDYLEKQGYEFTFDGKTNYQL